MLQALVVFCEPTLTEKKSQIFFISFTRRIRKWLQDSQEKADLLAQTFQQKSQLPPASTDDIPFFPVPPGFPNQNIIRSRYARKELSELRVNQATGPDGIAAAFLRKFAPVLDVPIAILSRRIFDETCWPTK